jgi:hypothetical protein
MMATTTNKRKTNDLHPYSVARWNGQPFHPDYVWNIGNEYANEISKLPFNKDTMVIGYTEGRWVVTAGKSKIPVVIDYVGIHADNLPRRMYNKELMEWLLEHKGVKITKTGWVSMIHQYQIKDENNYVEAGVLVRPNGSTELVQPTIDLL